MSSSAGVITNHLRSQTGSGHGHGPLNAPSGQGESEEESDLAVLLALFIPLAATVTAIFIIALFVRKMRRAESMHEVHRTNNLNEFPMTARKKTNTSGNSSVSSTSTATIANSSPSPSNLAQHGKSSSTISNNNSNTHQPLGKSSSSASIYCNSSYLRLAGHHTLHSQSSLPITGVSHSPTGKVPPPPWPLAQEYYTRSHYGLNKMHQQLIQQASLQAFSSMQSLNGLTLSRHYSDPSGFCTHSDPEIEVSSDESSHNSSTESNNDAKKSANKKFKRVLSAINFPRKIRQYQADRKRFNVYTIPMETREQLKHIYVY